MIPDGMLNRVTRVAPRQRQHNLRLQELEQLTADYRSGAAVNDLAARYDNDRHTVIDHVRRQGVPRRYPRLGEDEVREATRIYQSGASLVATGHRLGVDPGTFSRESGAEGRTVCSDEAMDLPRPFVIRESTHRIHDPLTPAKLARLGEALLLRSGQQVLDLACGSGEMLCTWARDHGIT
jgi:hypothetical protein